MIERIPFLVVAFVLLEIIPVSLWLISLPVGGEGGQMSPSVAAFFSFWVALLGILFIVLYAWFVRVYIRRYFYDINNQFITIKKGVFAPAEIHVQFQKIQDVYVDQDILDRIMGLYDVHIASATAVSAMEAHIDGVDYAAAEGLKELLLRRVAHGSGEPSGALGSMPSTEPHSAPVAKVVVPQGISSSVFPVSRRWVLLYTLVGLGTAIIIIFALNTLIFARGQNRDLSIAAMMGLEGYLLMANMILVPVLIVGNLAHPILWKIFFSFEFLPEYIVMRSGILAREERHLPYRSIQDVSVSQNVLARMFGIANVVIRNAATGSVIVNGRTVVVGGGITVPGLMLADAERLASITRNILQSTDAGKTGL